MTALRVLCGRLYRRAMLSRPEGLSDADVLRGLRQGWGLRDAEVDYAPVGFGSYHWQVRCGGQRWFATVDDLHARRRDDSELLVLVQGRLAAALAGTRQLRDVGLGFVVAPVPDASGAMLRALGQRHVLALYPFVQGRTRTWNTIPDREERAALVGRLAQLHAVDPSRCACILADDFVLPRRDGLHAAMADRDATWDGGPFAEPARALLTQHAGALAAALERYDRLVASVVRRDAGPVPTHGEPHPGNTIDTDTGTVLIDWDTLLLAPPERDLWSLHDDDPDVLDLYRKLTGRAADPAALNLYRLRWDLADIGLYVTQLRAPHERSEDTTEAWNGLQNYLNPTRW